ncbi:MAG: hypothetical protein CMI23_07875 [Opitutae bacterium]|nr:hypothetical protein [Opitutae bacterium]
MFRSGDESYIYHFFIGLLSGCGVARDMEEWNRETETFRQLDEAYKSGRITEKEYFDYKARLMNKENNVNVRSSNY